MPQTAWSEQRERQYDHIVEARRRGRKGRSPMNKHQLEEALDG